MKRIRVLRGVHYLKTGKVIGPDYRQRGTEHVWTPVMLEGEDRPVFVERGALERVGDRPAPYILSPEEIQEQQDRRTQFLSDLETIQRTEAAR